MRSFVSSIFICCFKVHMRPMKITNAKGTLQRLCDEDPHSTYVVWWQWSVTQHVPLWIACSCEALKLHTQRGLIMLFRGQVLLKSSTSSHSSIPVDPAAWWIVNRTWYMGGGTCALQKNRYTKWIQMAVCCGQFTILIRKLHCPELAQRC